LKFIGEVDKSRVPGLAAVLTNVARSLGPFSLKLGRLGKFNKGNAIRVVWLGVGGDCEQLAKLQTQIEGGLATLGITPEARQWRPHVTLAQDVEFVADDVFNSCLAESGAFDVGEFALVLSEERDRRRVYTPLYRFALTNNKA
jgi:2'-5' RNA ligase